MKSCILVCILFLMNNSANHFVSPTAAIPSFDKEGHRGCRGLLPENTIPAMIRALDLGVTSLEMDVVISSDNKVLLSHEPFFNHDISTTPDGREVKEAEEKQFNIFKMTYEETAAFDVGKRKHPKFPRQQPVPARKPLLAEVIDTAERYAVQSGRPLPFYNIETKSKPSTDGIFHPAPELFVSLLMDQIIAKKITDRTIIQSFDFRTLRIVHEKHPGILTAALVEGADAAKLDLQLKQLGFVPDIYSPYFGVVTRSLVEECHARKIRIIPWTVNDRATIDKLKSFGVDGIISDYPDLFTVND